MAHDSIYPSNDFPEKSPSENDFPVNKRDNDIDTEQAYPITRTEIEAPPDDGYGWIYVLCVFLINAHMWGINSSYGIFPAHYLETNTFPGASDLDFAFVGGLSLSMAQFIAPVATITTREWGARITLTIGIILQTAALLGASWSTEIWQLFLSQGVCFGFEMGMQFSATVGMIPQWSDRRRSLANGIWTTRSGIRGLIHSLASSALIQRWGTGWACRVLAIASAFSCGFSTIIIKDRNKAIGAVQIASHTSLLKRPEFLLTLSWGSLSVLGYVALVSQYPPTQTRWALPYLKGRFLVLCLILEEALADPL
ncbi:hypothetical protein BPOR_0404g00080 [Botrytis porri]|uniref:Major facilitator superfamily (MFS) profile domain-containing protein n=1 Tax=Botrytis porri TaxID=87229 RepID=A0A4Z1KIL8_9HELO|nr:hypothetical protein BPOR_0404g00080 [Botrytis porri]